MKIKNLNTKYAPQRLPIAGEIWKGKPHVGGLYLIVETGNHYNTAGTRMLPSKLSAVELEEIDERLGTYEGQDGLDSKCFITEHDYVCHSKEVTLTFPKSCK